MKQPNASETLQTSPLEKSGLKAVVDTTGEKTESVEHRLIKNEGEGTEIKKEIDSKFLNIMKTKQANKCECEECVGKRIEKNFLKRVTQNVKITFKSNYTPKYHWKIGGIPVKNLATNALAANISSLVSEIKQVKQNVKTPVIRNTESTTDDRSYSTSDDVPRASQSELPSSFAPTQESIGEVSPSVTGSTSETQIDKSIENMLGCISTINNVVDRVSSEVNSDDNKMKIQSKLIRKKSSHIPVQIPSPRKKYPLIKAHDNDSDSPIKNNTRLGTLTKGWLQQHPPYVT